jgi:hypothetical protein
MKVRVVIGIIVTLLAFDVLDWGYWWLWLRPWSEAFSRQGPSFANDAGGIIITTVVLPQVMLIALAVPLIGVLLFEALATWRAHALTVRDE